MMGSCVDRSSSGCRMKRIAPVNQPSGVIGTLPPNTCHDSHETTRLESGDSGVQLAFGSVVVFQQLTASHSLAAACPAGW
jgi:hypothetical protein